VTTGSPDAAERSERFSSFQRVKASDLLVQIDADYEIQAEADEDVDGSYTTEPDRARTSFLSAGLRAMAGWHDGLGVRDLGGSGRQLLYCLHT
jgi:hypothetical protein